MNNFLLDHSNEIESHDFVFIAFKIYLGLHLEVRYGREIDSSVLHRSVLGCRHRGECRSLEVTAQTREK